MKLYNKGNNQTLITSNTTSNELFYSYNTPVAGYINGEYVRTSRKWSVTTSRHINQYLGGNKAREVDQAWLDSLSI